MTGNPESLFVTSVSHTRTIIINISGCPGSISSPESFRVSINSPCLARKSTVKQINVINAVIRKTGYATCSLAMASSN